MADKIDKPQPISSAVMSFPQPPLRNAEEYLKAYSGYAYTAISAIAQEVASLDLHLFKNKFVKGQPETTEVYEHELLSVLHYANPLTTFYDLVEATEIYLELTGESFWVVLKQGTLPRELWLIRPDWIKIVPSSKDVIDHYTYHPGGNFTEKVEIPKDNMLHFRYFHPLNPYRGKGSVQAAALPLDIHTFAQEYNRNFFFNSAIPSLVFTTDKSLQEATVKRFINQWQSSYGGRAKSNKVAFLGSGLKMDKISVGGKEMDFTEQQRMMRDDILAVFKVPRTVLGLTDDVNRANADATTKAFMERVVTPRMRKFVGTLNEFLVPMYNDSSLFLDFTDPAPEDVENKLSYYENALKNGWMTPNEVRVEENMEPIPGGDIPLPYLLNPLVPRPEEYQEETEEEEEKPQGSNEEQEEVGSSFGKVFNKVFSKKEVAKVVKKKTKISPPKKKPFKHMIKIPPKRLEVVSRKTLEKDLTKKLTKFIGDLLEKKEGNDVGIKTPKKNAELFNEEGKDAYWRQFIKQTTRWEQRLRNIAVDSFEEQEHMVLDMIDNTVKYWRKEVRKGKESSAIPSLDNLMKVWLVAFLETVKEIYIEQGTYVLDFLGVGGTINISSDKAAKYLQKDTLHLIKDINETTRGQLRETLKEGFDKGEGVDQLKSRVKDVFETATTSRAEMIARTESLRASNSASVEAYRQSGVVQAKEWLAERDNRTCPFCMEMDGKVIGLNAKYFKKGDVFEVGDQKLSLDAMAVGEPPLHPQCYSKDTEVYTSKGWKLVKDVGIGESILTLNPKTLQLEDSEVVNTVSFKEDNVLHLTNKQHSFDMMVSKNHPFVGFKRVDRGKNGRAIEFVKYNSIKSLPKDEFKFYISSKWVGTNKNIIKIAGRKFRADDWCKFLGYYLSEGSTTKRKIKGGYQISIAQSKYLEEMYSDISVMPFRKVCLGKDKIYIYDNDIAEYLIRFGKSYEKFIPDNIKELDSKYLRIFLDAFRLGDGSIKKSNRYKGGNFMDSIMYSTSSEKLAGDLGELIIKSGKSVSYNIRKTKGKEARFSNGTYKINHDQIIIYELTGEFRTLKNINIEEIKYNDFVYDLEVKKNHTLLVRRNGKVVWGSNCRCTTIPVLFGE